MAMISEAHEMFMSHVRAAKLPAPERSYMLTLSARKPAGEVWFDFAWPDHKIAVQIDRDTHRIYEQAVRYVAEERGWRVCYFSGAMVRCGVAIGTVTAAFSDEIAPHDHPSPEP